MSNQLIDGNNTIDKVLKKDFDYTEFAVIPLVDAMICLGDDSVNNTRRIVVKRQKHSKILKYYGTAISYVNAKKLKSCDEFFLFD